MGEGIDGVVERMERLLATVGADGDPARFFLGTYLRTTLAVRAVLVARRFEDPAWVEAWDVDFAGLYLDVLAAFRRDPTAPAHPWRLALGARADLPPEAHVLLGMNAHINFDLPQSLLRVIPAEDFTDPGLLDRRRRDHERIDLILASRIGDEDVELQRSGGRRTPLDRFAAPANRWASRTFLRESRRKVWANTVALHRARLAGPAVYARRLAELESASAARVADLLRPGPVLLRLALRGFGVVLPG